MKKNAPLNKTINLPELGEGVTEGELIKWLVSVGDQIKTDQPIAEVMTDKASMEVPSPLDGVVESFSAKEGDTIQVGQSLLTIKGVAENAKTQPEDTKTQPEDTETQPENTKTQPENTKTQPEDTETQPEDTETQPEDTETQPEASPQHIDTVDHTLKATPPSTTSPSPSSNKLPTTSPSPSSNKLPAFDTEDDPSVLATPFTRRMAREIGVSLSQIKGSGLAGRITREDILKYSGKKSTSHLTPSAKNNIHSNRINGFSIPKEDQQKRIPLKGIRKKIAEKMQLSKAVIPHFTLLESADMEQLDKVKNTVKDMLKERKIKVTYLPFIMKSLLQTLKEFPELNASIDDFSKEIVIKNYYNFGVAVDTPRGLLVPVIKNVDKKSLAEISFEIQTLAEKARLGNISPDEMTGGTITITNIGSLGGEYATPIINAPETAILGMYRIYVKPHWDGSAFVPKKTMNFSLTCDHRLIDGAVSARALKSFIHKTENPLSLFI